MQTKTLLLIKEKIIKTDEVLKIYVEKKNELAKQVTKYQTLLVKYTEKCKEVDLLMQELNKIRFDHEKCSELQEYAAKYKVLSQTYEDLAESLNDYVLKYQTANQNLEENVKKYDQQSKQVEELQDMVTELEMQIEASKMSHAKEKRDLNLNRMMEKLNSAEVENDELRESLGQLEKDNKEMENKMQSLKAGKDDVAEQLANYKTLFADKCKELEAFKQDLNKVHHCDDAESRKGEKKEVFCQTEDVLLCDDSISDDEASVFDILKEITYLPQLLSPLHSTDESAGEEDHNSGDFMDEDISLDCIVENEEHLKENTNLLDFNREGMIIDTDPNMRSETCTKQNGHVNGLTKCSSKLPSCDVMNEGVSSDCKVESKEDRNPLHCHREKTIHDTNPDMRSETCEGKNRTKQKSRISRLTTCSSKLSSFDDVNEGVSSDCIVKSCNVMREDVSLDCIVESEEHSKEDRDHLDCNREGIVHDTDSDMSSEICEGDDLTKQKSHISGLTTCSSKLSSFDVMNEGVSSDIFESCNVVKEGVYSDCIVESEEHSKEKKTHFDCNRERKIHDTDPDIKSETREGENFTKQRSHVRRLTTCNSKLSNIDVMNKDVSSNCIVESCNVMEEGVSSDNIVESEVNSKVDKNHLDCHREEIIHVANPDMSSEICKRENFTKQKSCVKELTTCSSQLSSFDVKNKGVSSDGIVESCNVMKEGIYSDCIVESEEHLKEDKNHLDCNRVGKIHDTNPDITSETHEGEHFSKQKSSVNGLTCSSKLSSFIVMNEDVSSDCIIESCNVMKEGVSSDYIVESEENSKVDKNHLDYNKEGMIHVANPDMSSEICKGENFTKQKSCVKGLTPCSSELSSFDVMNEGVSSVCLVESCNVMKEGIYSDCIVESEEHSKEDKNHLDCNRVGKIHDTNPGITSETLEGENFTKQKSYVNGLTCSSKLSSFDVMNEDVSSDCIVESRNGMKKGVSLDCIVESEENSKVDKNHLDCNREGMIRDINPDISSEICKGEHFTKQKSCVKELTCSSKLSSFDVMTEGVSSDCIVESCNVMNESVSSDCIDESGEHSKEDKNHLVCNREGMICDINLDIRSETCESENYTKQKSCVSEATTCSSNLSNCGVGVQKEVLSEQKSFDLNVNDKKHSIFSDDEISETSDAISPNNFERNDLFFHPNSPLNSAGEIGKPQNVEMEINTTDEKNEDEEDLGDINDDLIQSILREMILTKPLITPLSPLKPVPKIHNNSPVNFYSRKSLSPDEGYVSCGYNYEKVTGSSAINKNLNLKSDNYCKNKEIQSVCSGKSKKRRKKGIEKEKLAYNNPRKKSDENCTVTCSNFDVNINKNVENSTRHNHSNDDKDINELDSSDLQRMTPIIDNKLNKSFSGIENEVADSLDIMDLPIIFVNSVEEMESLKIISCDQKVLGNSLKIKEKPSNQLPKSSYGVKMCDQDEKSCISKNNMQIVQNSATSPKQMKIINESQIDEVDVNNLEKKTVKCSFKNSVTKRVKNLRSVKGNVRGCDSSKKTLSASNAVVSNMIVDMIINLEKDNASEESVEDVNHKSTNLTASLVKDKAENSNSDSDCVKFINNMPVIQSRPTNREQSIEKAYENHASKVNLLKMSSGKITEKDANRSIKNLSTKLVFSNKANPDAKEISDLKENHLISESTESKANNVAVIDDKIIDGNDLISRLKTGIKRKLKVDAVKDATPSNKMLKLLGECEKSFGINRKVCNPKDLDVTTKMKRTNYNYKVIVEQSFKKLLNFPDVPDVTSEVVSELKICKPGFIVKKMLQEISQDYLDKPDLRYTPPAPPLTVTQRAFLILLLKLSKTNMSNISELFLKSSEEMLLSEKRIECIAPLALMYAAVCRAFSDIQRMRRTCFDGLYFMGDLVVPFLFRVLSSWPEVLPIAVNSEDIPLAKVLVQVVNLKTCNKPGYNLSNLRNLFKGYYEYPKERWNSDEVMSELVNKLKVEQRKDVAYGILILCKNMPSKWVFLKLQKHFMATAPNKCVIKLVGDISKQFSVVEDSQYIAAVQDWLRKTTNHSVMAESAT